MGVYSPVSPLTDWGIEASTSLVTYFLNGLSWVEDHRPEYVPMVRTWESCWTTKTIMTQRSVSCAQLLRIVLVWVG